MTRGGWLESRLSRFVIGIQDGTHGSFERVDADGHALLSAKNVQDGGLQVTEDESQISECDFRAIVSNGYPRKGDVLLTIVGTIGRACLYELSEPLAFQRSVCMIRPGVRVQSKFLMYSLQSEGVQDQLKLLARTSAQSGVYLGDVASLQLAVPDLEQQELIAEFLDRETAQIDAMIDAQQRLVDLLDERRTSTVQRVASGRELPPDVSSETWEPRPVKAFGVSQSGAGFPLDDQGDPSQELPFYKVGSLAGADERGLLHSSDDTVDRETARRLRAAIIPPGSSVLAKIGAALLLGRIRQTSQDSCIDNNMMAFIPNSRIVPRFAYYSLQQIDTEYIVNPGAVPSLNVRAFMNTAIAVPDPETQRRLVAFLDDAVERVETLRARAESSISLLRERRAAVITAAVTGRLDPRTGVERVEEMLEGAAL